VNTSGEMHARDGFKERGKDGYRLTQLQSVALVQKASKSPTGESVEYERARRSERDIPHGNNMRPRSAVQGLDLSKDR